MHPLYDVPTVIEDAADVFCIHCAGEVGVTVVPSVPAGCADPLKETVTQISSVLHSQCLSLINSSIITFTWLFLGFMLSFVERYEDEKIKT